MWFLWQMEPDSPAYNVGGMARFTGVLDVACFEAALQALIQRHETLRTTFPSRNGVAHQRVSSETGVRLAWKDFSALEREAREQRLQRNRAAAARLPGQGRRAGALLCPDVAPHRHRRLGDGHFRP